MRATGILIALAWLASGCTLEESGEESGEPAAAIEIGSPSAGVESAPPAAVLRELELTDPDGAPFAPLAEGAAKVQAFVFVTVDCPIANGYQPELARIHEDYRSRGVDFTMVQVEPGLELQRIRDHRTEYAIAMRVGIDREHALVRVLGASVTPEAVVLRASGEEWQPAYRGRVDDQVTAFGKRRLEAGQHDLRDALDAALDGRSAEPARTEAIGCPIPSQER